jgi:exo-beta-1,3-glucanase (GH17 family)
MNLVVSLLVVLAAAADPAPPTTPRPPVDAAEMGPQALPTATPPAAQPAPAPAARQEPFVRRPLALKQDGRWLGQGISYGPHRDGQRPGGPAPTKAQLREDLKLLASRFALLRLYAADEVADRLLSLIADEELPFKVLLGTWIAPETGPAGATAAAANRAQVETALKLSAAYPDLVVGLVIGNETQVTWSDHRVAPETLIAWLRRARAGGRAPVSTADDFAFWLSPESTPVAREVDFLTLHAYAMWNGKPLEEALAFTQEKYAAVVRRHFGLPVLLGEAGWATTKHTEGDQAKLILGAPGEGPQRVFFEQLTRWTSGQKIPCTWFEAFDENWKGGAHPNEVEKHWGLWRADRSPKAAVERWRPDTAPL